MAQIQKNPAGKMSDVTAGWFSWAPFYNHLAKTASGPIVEIGVWLGHSIAQLAKNLIESHNNALLIGVDSFAAHGGTPEMKEYAQDHDLYRECRARLNLADVDSRIILIPHDSLQACNLFANKSVYCTFIDADRSYSAVRADIFSWLPKTYGIMAGHDILEPSVRQAVSSCFHSFQIDEAQNIWIKVLHG